MITIDAMGTQKKIAETIIEKQADYILALKGNQGYLKEDVQNTFLRQQPDSTDKTVEKGHGRIETRKCEVIKSGSSIEIEQEFEYVEDLQVDYPSCEELLAARDRMLDKHPDLRYVGCHLGSMEWNTGKQAQFLDKYPNAALDMAARITHLKVQDRDKVRDFIIEYQDRLLYGTDIILRDANLEGSSSELFQKKLRNVYQKYWAYFTKDEVFHSE